MRFKTNINCSILVNFRGYFDRLILLICAFINLWKSNLVIFRTLHSLKYWSFFHFFNFLFFFFFFFFLLFLWFFFRFLKGLLNELIKFSTATFLQYSYRDCELDIWVVWRLFIRRGNHFLPQAHKV